MADKRISELEAITGANTAADDFFLVVDTSGAVTKKISRAELNNAIEQDVLSVVDINGGTIDGVTIGGASAGAGTFTNVTATGTINLSGATVSNGGSVTTVDINGGTIDGTVIGGSTPAAISGTTGQFGTSLNVDGTITSDGLTVDGNATINAQLQISSTGPFFKLTDTDVTGYARILGSSGNIYLDADPTNDNVNSQVYVRIDGNNVALFDDTGDISFYEDTGTTPKFFWDASAESVTIGTTVNSQVPLNVSAATVGSSNAIAFLRNSSADGNGLVVDVTNTPTDYVADFRIGNTSKVRIDSSGNVGIGTTIPSYNLDVVDVSDTSIRVRATGSGSSDDAFMRLSVGNADANSQIWFGDNSDSDAGSIRYQHSTDNLIIRVNASEAMRIDSSGVVRPGADNTQTLGAASFRWSVVYAGTGTINTSDEREKQQIADLDDAERRVAVAIKGLVKKYKYNDAVTLKGDDARIHVGVIAQEVIAAFAAEGLDATRYALLCHDTWEAEPEEVDKNGNVINPGIEAGERYGIRYDELLAFMIAAL